MEIEIMGAAGGEVTGSLYRVRNRRANILVDCGMFQGGVAGMDRNRELTGGDEARCDAVVLTHAHLDHTGRLPLWIKRGFRGPIFASQATLDLADIILQDSAKIQAQDAERTNRKRERAGQTPVLPLYGPEDVARVREQGRFLEWGVSTEVAEGMRVRLFEAGHLLGSASVELTVEEAGRRRVIVFSGDLGPPRLPIVRDFDPPPRADLVFLESTYGDRNHRPYEETVDELEGILREMVEARGKILVPTFAIGRAQQILYHLASFFRSGKLRPFPVYLDSPMAAEASRVYARHPELFDDEMRLLAPVPGGEPVAGRVRATVTADESRALNDLEGPMVILAGSGMCTAGRILHHFRQNLWKDSTRVVIVGYQSRGSLGRRLIEGEKLVMIHGEPVAVRAQIHTLGGFSAHAGQRDLLDWLSALEPSRPRVLLTHGEDRPRTALAQAIRERFDLDVSLPDHGEIIRIPE